DVAADGDGGSRDGLPYVEIGRAVGAETGGRGEGTDGEFPATIDAARVPASIIDDVERPGAVGIASVEYREVGLIRTRRGGTWHQVARFIISRLVGAGGDGRCGKGKGSGVIEGHINVGQDIA